MELQGIVTLLGQVYLLSQGLYGPAWAGAQLALLTSGDLSRPGAVWADAVEADFAGYARRTITWGAPSWDDLNSLVRVVQTQVEQWSGPGDGTRASIAGVAIVQASESGSGSGSVGAPLLLACAAFGRPVSLVFATDLLAVAMELNLTANCQLNVV